MRVLLVEDDPAIAESVARGLNAEGFVTETANNGIDGLWMAHEQPFDLAILDIMLPGLNGYEVCKRLRAGGSGTPILMLTAKDGELDEADALDLGADDFLSKPFSFVVLLARVRALLRRAPAAREPVLVSGDLRLDPATKQCWRGDIEVVLTAREFTLMEFLLRRKGFVVSRNTIATHVWDAQFDVDSNVVEVYIGYLRRKVDKPFDRNDIRTVRGLGYRLLDTPGKPLRGGDQAHAETN